MFFFKIKFVLPTVVLVVGLSAASWWQFRVPHDPFAEYHLATNTAESPLFRICSAHQRLMIVDAVNPSMTDTLFGVLGLDPNVAPFAPAANCKKGKPAYDKANTAVAEALERQTAPLFREIDRYETRYEGDSPLHQMVHAMISAAAALGDDDTRKVYLSLVLPWEQKLKNNNKARAERMRDACIKRGLWVLESSS